MKHVYYVGDKVNLLQFGSCEKKTNDHDQYEHNLLTLLPIIINHCNIHPLHINLLLLFAFCFARGSSVDHLLRPAGHLLTPAMAYVRLLQDPLGTSKSPPTN